MGGDHIAIGAVRLTWHRGHSGADLATPEWMRHPQKPGEAYVDFI
jgi:hypothetical protein